ncbi:MAG TPA: hypothetical protein ENO00_00535 [Deltaproteobacteria bacterium]|nr:hypothetical protein [Deltaproteobacteria bacterium]
MEDKEMRSLLITSAILGFSLLTFLQGCSGVNGLTAPDARNRSVQGFFGHMPVFEGDFSEPYRDLDIATLVRSEPILTTGSPAVLSVDNEPTGLSIMVSCRHEAWPVGDQAYLAWLKDNGEVIETRPFGESGQGFVEFKFPKVDCIYIPGVDQENSHVVVAVSFMWRLPNAQPPDNNWRLGVKFLHWSGEAFLETPIGPADAEHLWLPAGAALSDNCWGHDIAFNPQRRDVYLVFTAETNAIQYPWRLKYYHLIQPGPTFVWQDTGGPWWAISPNFIANCWLPSIDIGKLALQEYGGAPRMILGVAFTAKMEGVSTYRVAGNFWCPDIDGDQDQTENVFYMVNPYVQPERDAGLPCLDISPNNTVGPYFAVSFVQSVDALHEYEVWMVDSINNDPIRLERPQGYRQKILPSVACNYTVMGDKAVSVSMYENLNTGEPSGNYRVAAVKVNIFPVLEVLSWAQVQTIQIPGPWNPFNVIGQDAGVATDIQVTATNDYYIGFSDKLDATATSVYAAWGNTNY